MPVKLLPQLICVFECEQMLPLEMIMLSQQGTSNVMNTYRGFKVDTSQ